MDAENKAKKEKDKPMGEQMSDEKDPFSSNCSVNRKKKKEWKPPQPLKKPRYRTISLISDDKLH